MQIGNYTIPYKSMVCSCGIATPKKGTYNLNYKYRWLALMGGVYGQYCTRITGNILFHSVPYLRNGDESSLEYWEYDKLGTSASAGCIRLTVEDAKWIYENCSSNTRVTFFSSNDTGPLGKPSSAKISNSSERNWDPTDSNPNNPWNKKLDLTFNANFYADNNSDLKAIFGYNEKELKAHWLTFGINEGRVASPIFDVKYYLNYNKDLSLAFGTDYSLAHIHFIDCGINEGRIGSENFNVNFYKNYYTDLNNMSNRDAFSHYINFGKNEGRISKILDKIETVTFNPYFYADNNNDLKLAFGYNITELKNHWYRFGIKEGRESSELFDVSYYLSYNADLQTVFGNDKQKAFEHFIVFGLNEGRKTSSNYDVSVYKNSNSDLKMAFDKNNIEYFIHYLTFGKNENRIKV